MKSVEIMQRDENVLSGKNQSRGCYDSFARCSQEACYQFLAATFWDSIMGGFRPGRLRAVELLELQPTDYILLVGEGSGLDFDCLPEDIDKTKVIAFDFSSEMVRQAKKKALTYGIPPENVLQGDAQDLSFLGEKQFNKIYFPLSIGSIPHPRLALLEAERVLAPGGKIIVFEKLVDNGAVISRRRQALNWFTRCIFADINRNLTTILGEDSPLQISHYETTENRLEGCLGRTLAPYYRIAVLTRKEALINEHTNSYLQNNI
ncbi:MAG: methyltransferase domain-containing protein [Gammaproteobacteria bacterium]|nr:methyltransferase domain-containing protein [Gammaproteobacteria bacterium]MCD8543048.1 methyltransferase domain-containing protein [Gammaproteobacteria bacterium]MCD8573841.1 methyltransferase domain-containing protein [Gammaproteobacteria bacterium]